MHVCRHVAEQNGEQMGAAKIAIELARDLGLAQARQVERMANSALMLNPDYRAGIEKYITGLGAKGKKE
jgi:enoyl-CoA hydratase